MGTWFKVGRIADFREGRGLAVRVGGETVAIFRTGGVLRAIQDRCPHMGASLADGRVDRGRVTCHWHGWCFDLRTGQSDRRAKTWLRARVFEIREEGDDVYVALPEAPPPPEEEPWVRWDDGYLKESTFGANGDPGAGETDDDAEREQ